VTARTVKSVGKIRSHITRRFANYEGQEIATRRRLFVAQLGIIVMYTQFMLGNRSQTG
jgi:hypothetical protein